MRNWCSIMFNLGLYFQNLGLTKTKVFLNLGQIQALKYSVKKKEKIILVEDKHFYAIIFSFLLVIHYFAWKNKYTILHLFNTFWDNENIWFWRHIQFVMIRYNQISYNGRKYYWYTKKFTINKLLLFTVIEITILDFSLLLPTHLSHF